MTDNTNDLMAKAVDSIMFGMSEAFSQIWTRPDAARIIEGFLDNRVVFQVDRLGITIAERTDDPPPAPKAPPSDTPTGGYL